MRDGYLKFSMIGGLMDRRTDKLSLGLCHIKCTSTSEFQRKTAIPIPVADLPLLLARADNVAEAALNMEE